MAAPIFSRRHLLGGAAALSLGTLPFGRARAAGALTVGFIYVGPKDDYGYNQAHAQGAPALKAISGVQVVEEENVRETTDVQKTMESMINLDGASLIFPTSFGYFDPHMLIEAKKNPKVQFRHCGGLWTEANPKNAGSYFGYIAQGQYLNGIVAAHASKSKKLGFVAAKPIPQVLNNVNGFLLGARSVDPSITVQVIFTGEWSLAVKEAEATNALIDAGADVITCHVDSPKVVVETAARRGAFVCGYHADQSALAPKGYLRRVELGLDLQGLRRRHAGRQGAPELFARRPARRVREDEPLRTGRLRGGAQECRCGEGRDDEGRLRHHQGPAQGQQGQRDRRLRQGARRERGRA